MKWLKDVFYFFPVQITLLQFKKNIFIIFLWAILFTIVGNGIGLKLGIPYLFLDPEYLGEINYKSTFIMGVFLAFFIGAYNIATFILDGYKFMFLAYSRRPFINYSLNNGIIPIVFILVYMYQFYLFQLNDETQSRSEIFLELAAFVAGMVFVSGLMYIYFSLTNTNWYKYIAKNIDSNLKKNKYNRSVVMQKVVEKNNHQNRVDSYYAFPFGIKKVDEILPYNKEGLIKIFDQNHLNAIVFQFFIFIIILTLIVFDQSVYFQLPAVVSILLLFTLIVMVLGFIYYWFKKWYLVGIFLIAIGINFLYSSNWISKQHNIDSIDYSTKKLFTKEALIEYNQNLNKIEDSLNTIQVLKNWKSKYPTNFKPKMVLICVSGGGLRAASWSFESLQFLEKEFKHQFLNQSVLITGASGGMIGAAYFRENYLKAINGEIDLYDKTLGHNLSKDLLNAIALKMLLHDPIGSISSIFQTVDRGVAFENKFNQNTNFILQKPLDSYREYEKNSIIPMMILSPAIVQNSSKMFISAQGVSYMVQKGTSGNNLNGIEYNSFFKNNEKYSLNFLTALRMSASFPYISPVIPLPTEPQITVTDAGVADSYGVKDAMIFATYFNEWINQNTSGVVLLTIRDSEKYNDVENYKEKSAVFEVVYDKYFDLQDLYNDQLISQAMKIINNFEEVPFVYTFENITDSKFSRRASLSWHLTGLEKENISESIDSKQNIHSLGRLKILLNKQVALINEK